MMPVMLIGAGGKLSSSVGFEEGSIRPLYIIIRSNGMVNVKYTLYRH